MAVYFKHIPGFPISKRVFVNLGQVSHGTLWPPWSHRPIPGVLEAMEKAQREGLGAVSLDGKLVDIASIKQADPRGPWRTSVCELDDWWRVTVCKLENWRELFSINHRTISMGHGFHGVKFPEGNILNSEIGGAKKGPMLKCESPVANGFVLKQACPEIHHFLILSKGHNWGYHRIG